MFGQSLRGPKLSTGFNASAGGGSSSTSEFHAVRLRETERARAVEDLGAREERSRVVPPSYFVPSLQAICADSLAQNFATTPEIDSLQGEHAELYDMIIECLPVAGLPQEVEEEERAKLRAASDKQLLANDNASALSPAPSQVYLPLDVVVSRVVSETYWKRCCRERWSTGQLSKFTGGGKQLLEKQYGWKRLFLEQVLNSFLMSLRSGVGDKNSASGLGTRGDIGHPQGRTHSLGTPAFLASPDRIAEDGAGGTHDFQTPQLSDEDARALSDLCAMCRDYVHTVELPCQYTHLNWYEHLFSRLPGILDFRLSYGACTAGIGYDKGMLGFSNRDAESVRYLLSRYTSLEALRLPMNRLDGPQATMIAAGLVGNTRLRVLDLSRNTIDDAAVAKGIAVLLCQPEFPLEDLNLSDNRITAAGAKALASALAVNRTLAVLNLGQNRIGDAEGGAALVSGLGQNPRSQLRELNLANNLLAGETVGELRRVLPELATLAALNLAGNSRIGSTGAGDVLCEAVLGTTSLRFIDVRFCDLSAEQVSTVEAAVQDRVERAAAEERSDKEEKQRSSIAVLVASRPSGRY